MKKTLFIISILFLGLFSSEAQVREVTAPEASMTRKGRRMSVDMKMDLTSLKVPSEHAALLTPWIVGAEDSLELKSVGIYGRRRHYHFLRNGVSMISGADEEKYMAKNRPDEVEYQVVVPYEDWMDGSRLILRLSDWGCCDLVIGDDLGPLASYNAPKPLPPFYPEYIYVQPPAELKKVRFLKGSAFIDFPVNKTEIYPEYRRNTVELSKIRATIDTVRNDTTVTVDTLWFKGYASPESPYSHNRNLAVGRTASLKKYIQGLYDFKKEAFITDHEPEDWEGLRAYVDSSSLEHRDEILAIIDTDMDPDAKEARIKSRYPEEYRYLLQNCYPALRHTDYKIAYTVTTYTKPKDILDVMKKRPQNLSLNEFYIAALTYKNGSEEFVEVFDTAVRMFPEDTVANLNAANGAMSRGDLDNAAKYLAKAGDSVEAVYARGVYAYLKKDTETARELLKEASAKGIVQADDVLKRIDAEEKKAIEMESLK